jgi:hypothetical protein
MQMWANPPVRFDPSRFKGVVRDIREIKPIPEPGDPPFYIRFEFAGEPLAIGSLITVFRSGDAIGRGLVGNDGSVNIVPDANVPPRNLSLSLQQDGAFPESEPVEDQAPREQTSLTFTQPTYQPAASNGSNPFDGKLTPTLEGASIRVVYTPNASENPNGVIEHTVTIDAKGQWHDDVDFQYYNPNHGWTANAFYDGDADHAPSESNTIQFSVND